MPVINLHGTPTFQGEAMLLGWAENNRDGMTVRLALDASDENGHPFKGLGTGKHGQRFMVVCVPVDDENSPAPFQGITGGDPSEPSSDEVPVAGSPRGSVGGQSEQAPDRRRLEDMNPSNAAALAIKMPQFQHWIGAADESEADTALKRTLTVGSKSDLNDETTGAAKDWRALLANFRAWQTEQQYGDMIR